MVTAAVRLRPPLRDPARPVPRWFIPAMVALGVALSGAGWTATVQLSAAQRAAAVTTVQRDRADDQRDALARLVEQRCHTGTVTDRQVCAVAGAQVPG